jgi:hypothetical protein
MATKKALKKARGKKLSRNKKLESTKPLMVTPLSDKHKF